MRINQIHKQRIIYISIILGAVMLAASFALYALKQNIDLFYGPSAIKNNQVPYAREFRLGGLVAVASIHHATQGLQTTFAVTDQKNTVIVAYNGILPDLFREGQAVVVEGKLNSQGIVVADQVLAKHDERYMPKQVAEILQKGKS